MDGDRDGAQVQGEERTRQQDDPQAEDEQQGQKAPEQVGAPDDDEICTALAERDEKIAEAAKTVESTGVLAKQIEELKAASDVERCEFELHPGRARCRKAVGRANLVGWLGPRWSGPAFCLEVWVGTNPGTNNPERSV